MNEIQFTILDERLKKIEQLLLNIQPKKKIKQTKIIDNRLLEEQIEIYKNKYSPSMITDFLLYWSEGDRWKKEKVFDISKRLDRWKRQEDKWNFEKSQRYIIKSTEEKPVFNIDREKSDFSRI